MNTPEESAIRSIFEQLLEAWNRRSALDFAALFEDGANVTGFDGSQMDGRAAIAEEIGRVFAHHQTAAYVGKVRQVRFLSPEVALLRAVVGMIPPGHKDLNPAVNAIQTLVALKTEAAWRITLFQSTPAQFHGRPDLAEALTQELREML
jgi:uncharacterized protein (TIGR02246 family)